MIKNTLSNKINLKLNSNKLLNTVFVLSLLMIGFTRLLIYFKYNLVYIDSDQAYMWYGALDYSLGNFYEPRYYGQNYNTFMEGLFALPLIWLNVNPYYALPITTHFISLFPFLFTSYYLFVHAKKIHALLVLILLISMPIEYDLLNGLPRGFVTGLFFTSFFIINILNPLQLKYFAFNACMAVIGYFVNPNSILVSLPFAGFVFLHHYKNPTFYKVAIVPVLLIWPTWYFFNHFYQIHPGYNMHPLENEFSFSKFFMENISNLDIRFGHISPYTVYNCLILITLLLILGISLFYQNKKGFASLFLFIGLLLITFCFAKVSEGSSWVYMSQSRMYLGIPILIILLTSLLNFKIPYLSLWLLTVVFWCYKITVMDVQLKPHLSDRGGVLIRPYRDICNITQFYKQACENTKSKFLLVSSNFWGRTFLSNAGPVIEKDFPEVSETYYEKRYWIREKNEKRVIKDFVFLSSNYQFHELLAKDYAFELQRLDMCGLYYVKNNRLKMGEFIRLVNAVEKVPLTMN